jgi:hypothetical protein
MYKSKLLHKSSSEHKIYNAIIDTESFIQPPRILQEYSAICYTQSYYMILSKDSNHTKRILIYLLIIQQKIKKKWRRKVCSMGQAQR